MAPPTKGGTVTLMQTSSATGQPQWLFVAGFAGASSSQPSSQCSQQVQGECTLSDCTYDTRQKPLGPSPQRSAGTLSLYGALFPLTIAFDAGGLYQQAGGAGQLWTEGGALTVTAPGGDVPPFSFSLPRMGLVRVTSPVAPNARIVVDRRVPFNVTWTGSSVGEVWLSVLSFEQLGALHHTVSLACTYPAGQGGASVPALLLGRMLPGPAGSISVSGKVTTQARAGEWVVHALAISGDTTMLATFQ